ncbi:hypothetical protein D9O50_17145 [Oxalobacteraceae bacterium CAVE-383]|nr:hypothetical protein D9O50_17145 [Oxalobacteraceae bacterium CAVE-383]
MAELRRRTYDESNCFHIRSRRFFGLRFRRSESAVASNYSKNITSVFLGDFQHLESNHGSPWLSRAPSTRPAARDSIAPDDDTASIRSTEESDSGSAIMIEGMFADVIAYADRLMGRLPEQLALSDAEAETEAAKNVMRPRSPGADSADRRPFKARVVDELLKPHQK